MDFKTVERETEKIKKFLGDRDWDTRKLGDVIANAQREIERIQERAATDIQRVLKTYEREAQRAADNKVFTLWEEEHIPLTKREQQASATEVRHIHAAIVKIGGVE